MTYRKREQRMIDYFSDVTTRGSATFPPRAYERNVMVDQTVALPKKWTFPALSVLAAHKWFFLLRSPSSWALELGRPRG